ncbi:MAG: DUF615 domain-containing protein [Desulfovibrio sp.]|jgi:ribosome-associated protein|nr:DUF615 domain-containing protein [Desulfovibrio sp.]
MTPRSRQRRGQVRSSEEGQNRTKPSRSAQKRRSLALQEMGERLIGLAPQVLASFGLPPALREAVAHYAGTRSHEARRRQLQYIGRLMRELDETTLCRLLRSGFFENLDLSPLAAKPMDSLDE